jgi:hypothetical protein
MRRHEKMRQAACYIEQACQRHEAEIGSVILGSNLMVFQYPCDVPPLSKVS